MRLLTFADSRAMAHAAAEEFARAAEAAGGPFRVALSGGHTPRELYALLADEPYRSRLPWPRLHWFWGDERCVPPDHPQSNYRMAREALLDRAPIPKENVHRVLAERPPEAAAAEYEDQVWRALGPKGRLDWIFLGIGPDGHTASLFPGTAALQVKKRYVAANWVPQQGMYRVTFTYGLLNSAARVLFYVASEDKAEAARRAIEEPPTLDVPSSLVRPVHGELSWFLDRAAASKLTKKR